MAAIILPQKIFNSNGSDLNEGPLFRTPLVCISASKSSIRRFVITEKAPTRAFSWLKAATAFTFKALLRHYGVDPTVSQREIGSATKLS